MKIIKVVKSEKVVSKEGKEYNPSSYWVVDDNEKRLIMIKPVFKNDYRLLDFACDKKLEE